MAKYKELYGELQVKRYKIIHTSLKHETGFYKESEEYDLPLDVAIDFMEHLQLVIPKVKMMPPNPKTVPQAQQKLQIENKKEK